MTDTAQATIARVGGGRWRRTRRVVTTAFVGAALAVTPATADVAVSSVERVEVTRAGDTLTVSGAAVFADAGDAVVGTDPSGDVDVPGIGADLTQATVTEDRAANELVFRAHVADAMAEPLFTVPEAMHYLWYLRVTNGDQSQNFQLLAMRSGQYKRTIPYPDYLFRVNSCGRTTGGEPLCFDVAGTVKGTMANGVVEWRVPKALIAALPGAVIDAPEAGVGAYGVETALGASGAAYMTDSDYTDQILPEAYVVGPAVAVGIRPATARADTTRFTVAASVGPDGTFSAKAAAPKHPGDYVLSVRACHGHTAGCGYADAAVPAAE